jgi:hypothetical protein
VKKDLRKGEKAEPNRLERIGQLGNDPLDREIKGNCQKKRKKRNKRKLSYSKQERRDMYIQFL